MNTADNPQPMPTSPWAPGSVDEAARFVGSGATTKRAASSTTSRFTIEKLHAQGGLGQVSLAMDGQLKRPVALKEIRPDRRTEDARHRFVNEAEITGQLEHPGIVPIYALETDAAGDPYYAMRFIQGRPMSEAIKAYHQTPSMLAFRDLLQRFVSVCQTLGYAHSKGVIHRDLKPANVMLGEYGETLVVDWGLAKRVVSGQSSVVRGNEEDLPRGEPAANLPAPSDATQPGQALGTPAYMAPEQARGEWERVGPAADIFSLGATLYELLTNQRPMQGQDVFEVIENARAGQFPSPRKVKADVPKPLEAVCLKAMALNSEQRYGTAKELAADVEHWLADEPVMAYPELWIGRARRWTRKHRTVVASAFFVLLTAVVGLVVGLFAVEGERRQTELERQATVRERDEKAQALSNETRAHQMAMAALRSLADDLVEDQLASATHLTEQNKEFLRNTIKHYEGFAALAADAAASRAIRAEAHARVGAMRHRLGDLNEAESAYRFALELHLELAAQFPDRSEFRDQAGRDVNNLGTLLRQTGRVNEAKSAYVEGLTLYERLVADFPTQPLLRKGLATTHGNMAHLLLDSGRLREAESAYATALSIMRQLGAALSLHPEFREELAREYLNLGIVFNKMGRPQEAESAYRKGLEARKQLASDFPARPRFRGELAAGYNSLGLLLSEMGRFEQAESAHADALLIQKQLAADSPTRPELRQDLARTHNNLAILLRRTGRLTQAESAYADALALQKQLVAEFPTRPEFRTELAATHMNLAVLFWLTGRLPESETAFGQALAVRTKLVADFPDRPDFREDLGQTQGNIGNLFRDTGRPKEAESNYLDALQLFRQLVADFPDAPDYRNDLAGALNNLAILSVRHRDFAAARRLLDDAFPNHQEALQISPQNRQYRRFYRNSLSVLIKSCAGQGDRVAALAAAAKRRDLGWNPAADAYDAACALAQCVPIVEMDDKLDAVKRQAEVEFYADEAMKMLRDAIAKGYKDIEHLKKDDDLKPLREREDYKKLVKELEAKP